jgi:GTP-binding protein
MKFYDKVQIICISWKWWDGATSARREAWVPYGGPNGGNGGHGGSVIFQADSNYNTLLHLRFQKERAALHGFPGESSDKYGKSAEDLIIPVPVGSIIKIVHAPAEGDEEHIENHYEFDHNGMLHDNGLDEEDELHPETVKTSKIVYHFTEHGEQFVICKGGIGGAGNMHFKNSTVQFPDFSLAGEPGQKKTIEIELQLLADVGLIGMPSVGKSSIINSISNSKAKVAEYHFTTLVPNLGSVIYNDQSWNIIDIPGLVEGASEGKGLGNEFLRHVLKARLFAFVLDISRYDQGILEFGKLRNEILTYIQTRFIGSQEFGFEIEDVSFEMEIKTNENNKDKSIVLNIHDQEGRLLLQKGIIRIMNKVDEVMEGEVVDSEVINEYKNQLIEHISESFKTSKYKIKTKIPTDVIGEQIFTYSIIFDQFRKPLLQFMYNKLQIISAYVLHFDPVSAENKQKDRSLELLGDVEDEDIHALLLEMGYQVQDWTSEDIQKEYKLIMDDDDSIEEELEDKDILAPKKVFVVYEKDLSRLAYQLPRWKVLAEEWFWRVMKQQGLHKWFNKAGVKIWDILWIQSDYNSKRHIIIQYALKGKTSYKHQKLT